MMTPIQTFRDPYEDRVLTIHDLPINPLRWHPKRKELVCIAIQEGAISITGAAERFKIDILDLCKWIKAYREHGRAGLMVSSCLT
jgi:hypothetical protein